MSVADKYGAPAPAVSAETLKQVQAAGQTLADKGVVQQSSLGNTGTPAPTPATKYGAPANSEAMGRSLSQEAPSRSR
jgi:hypothetical protein